MYIVVRVDGRSFSRLTERTCEKPFDPRFHQRMTDVAKALLATLHGRYAYTESDEISVLLPRGAALFDREVEKGEDEGPHDGEPRSRRGSAGE